MKIKIQYPQRTKDLAAAVVEVETPDLHYVNDEGEREFLEEESLALVVNALNVALKTVWGDKAQTFDAKSVADEFAKWFNETIKTDDVKPFKANKSQSVSENNPGE